MYLQGNRISPEDPNQVTPSCYEQFFPPPPRPENRRRPAFSRARPDGLQWCVELSIHPFG